MIGCADDVQDGEKSIYEHVDHDMPIKCESRLHARRRASIKDLVFHIHNSPCRSKIGERKVLSIGVVE